MEMDKCMECTQKGLNKDRDKRNQFMSGEYLLVKEAGKFIGVTGNTLRRWEKQGKISTLRHPFNKYRLYKKQHLLDMMESIKPYNKE